MSMVDLENMLLAGVGRTSASNLNKQSHQSARRHKGSYSNDETDPKDDDSDDDCGSQVPLKKKSRKTKNQKGKKKEKRV